tara:strand:+ start:7660 stop:9408 length:1749 start_codon:yes stop_codon:yes gene_type:complete
VSYFFIREYKQSVFSDFKLHLTPFNTTLLNKKTILFTTIFFLSSFTHGVFAQNLSLNIKGIDSIQTENLKELSYTKKHDTKKSVYKEINTIQDQIKRIGFFTATIDTIISIENNFTAIFNLGKKTEEVILIIPKNFRSSNFNIRNDSIRIKTNELENFTNSLLYDLDKKGNSFSEITYRNPKYRNNNLVLELVLVASNKRQIDKVIIKGYTDFSKSHIKNFFQLKKNTVFSKQKIEEVSELTNSLNFIKEIKKPEVLFKKDSTLLYLFIEKLETNSFDGLINFASKDNGEGLLLNGNLDLKLNNIFNSGENFELFWNRVAEEKSQFKINTRIPYILKSSLSTSVGFDIYRQDSTFLNTSFNLKSEYQLNSRSKISISYSSENSNYLLDLTNDDFESYSNQFFGIAYNFRIASKNNLFKELFNFNISHTFGKRKSDLSEVNQYKLNFQSVFNIKTSKRSYLYIRNESGLLNSRNYLTNELFRIGGINSIRGFNEQSIFTNKYTYFNTEYRYLTSSSSYLYSISDIGFYNTLKENSERILGIGLGYSFKINASKINLGYVSGVNSNNSTGFKNSKLAIKWTSFF